MLCAGSGAAGLQALEQIGARGGEVALVLADLRLPDMSGMELMARVHGLDPAAKRRFHGPGRSPRRHLGFVVVHVQPFALALVVPGFGWTAAAAIYGLVVAGAVVVLAAPPGLRRPVAFAATTLASAIALTAVTVPAAVAWFAPVLLIKLLLGHLLPGEAAPRGGT